MTGTMEALRTRLQSRDNMVAQRLPSIQRQWPMHVEHTDAEGWPASRFRAARAEIDLAVRDVRRNQRHTQQSELLADKTLATFDFKALPGVTRVRIEALAAADWVDTGGNLIAIGNSGARKCHVLSAMGHALVGTGKRVFSTSTTEIVRSLQAARRDLVPEADIACTDLMANRFGEFSRLYILIYR